jgi:hypothetical protein
MSNLQILADEQCEMLIGGRDSTGVAAVGGRTAIAANTELLSRNNTELLSRNTVVVNTARVNTVQANLGVSAGVGIFFGVGAATQDQSNSNTIGIQQRGV